MKKILSFLLLGLASVAMAGTGDALSVLNAFLATFAKENPAWKTDITLTSDPAHLASGRQLGYSAMVGYYSFLPKTWDQLTDTEKNAVYADPRLKSFIVSLRNTQNYPSLTSTETPMPMSPSYPVEGYASAQGVAACQQQQQSQMQPQMMAAPQGYYAAPQGYYAAPAPITPNACYYGMPAPQSSTIPSSPATTYYFPVTIGGQVPSTVAAPATLVAPTPTYVPAAYAPQSSNAVPYYLPASTSAALTSPLPVSYNRPQVATLRVTPEEMPLARPLNVYMQTVR